MNNLKSGILVCLFFLVVSGELFARQTTQTHLFTDVDDHVNLPHHAVHHLLQDEFGFIWISTRNGLCRYDGSKCTLFGEREKGVNRLNSNMVWLTYEDAENRIWIGTKGGGLSVYDPRKDHIQHYQHHPENAASLSHDIVTAIFQDADNRMWIGTDGGGLNRVSEVNNDSLSFQKIEFENLDTNQLAVLDILEDKKSGKLWIATYGEGILVYNPQQQSVERIHSGTGKNALSDDYVMSLEKQGQTIWAGTKFGGLNKITINKQAVTHYRHQKNEAGSLPHDFVWNVFIDEEKRLWVSTYGGGLVYFDNEKNQFVHIRDLREDGFSDKYIMQVMQGSQGQYWVATDNEGAFHFDPKSVYCPVDFKWEGVDDFSNLIIHQIKKDSRNRYWIMTNQGIYTLGQTMEVASRQGDDFGSSIFYKMAEDAGGRLWFASNQYLHYLNPETGTTGTVDTHGRLNVAGTDRLFDVLVDDDNNLWLASDGGLIHYDPTTDQLQLFRHQPGDETTITGNKIDHLFKDGDHLWVSTDDQGVSRFNTTTKRAQDLNLAAFGDLPEVKTINDIERDQRGNLWLGSSGHGAFVLYRSGVTIDSVEQITSAKGLISDRIIDMDMQEEGVLLVSDEGLSWMEPDSAIKNIRFPRDISRTASPQFAKPDSLYLFSRNQIVQLQPQHIRHNMKEPPIQITGMDIYGDPVFTLNDFLSPVPIVLEHTQNFLTLRYRVLNYKPSAHYVTQYMLEGHDPYWLNGKDHEAVNYTNLVPGEYVFKTRFSNNRSPKREWAIPIVIKAPFWQQTWFRLFVLVCVAGILYSAYRYRMYYLLKEEKIRNRLARDLHDDLSATLSSISFFSEAAQKVQANNEEETARFLKLIEAGAVESKEKINDIIWAIDPENDDWSAFLKKCKRYASDMFDSKEIQYQIEMADNFSIPADLEIRQNLWLIFKEMVNNLLKHAQATKAKVRFVEENNGILLEISDNGTGIDETEANGGRGIKNIYERARQIGAKAEFVSDKPNGTTWKLTLYS